MPTRIRRPIGPNGWRRGVTLVEMLVVVALVVLMMTILVQIFQSATGAMSISRTTTEMDVTLRQIESIIRSDLAGVTAKMTPPNDPQDQRGYFEYGENAPADLQGEDTDDYMAMTTKAPDGVFFTGRQTIQQPTTAGGFKYTVAPITSQVAEVIYFLRNGNLYRRVFLVVPDRAKSITRGPLPAGGYNTSLFGSSINVSWQGLNDISCRPNPNGSLFDPIPNTLGDLTNRENRRFSPRFIRDFGQLDSKGAFTGPSDGVVDDFNNDGLPDYYPTLYSDGTTSHLTAPNGQTHNVVFPSGLGRLGIGGYNVFAFPFIYPGMYSLPKRYGTSFGWSHSLAPNSTTVGTSTVYVNNHSPLAVGDNLLLPVANQTWWGFPTWRETMTAYTKAVAGSGTSTGTAAVGWADPVASVANYDTKNYVQPLGLQPFDPKVAPTVSDLNFLPPIATFATPLPGTDTGAGSASFIANPATTTNPDNPRRIWEDDLLLTGVRSFDIKAYDLNAPLYNTPTNGFFSAGYQDLGYGSTDYESTGSTAGYILGPNGNTATVTTVSGVNSAYSFAAVTPPAAALWQGSGAEPVGFGHEGRIPPLPSDYRLHPRKPYLTDVNGNNYPYNIGDPGTGVIRLTRVWDSWSTDYTNAPDTDISLTNYSPGLPAVYPSFPPPYPTALRGIQIQIRMTDARGERTKALTIRHDFTDKLN